MGLHARAHSSPAPIERTAMPANPGTEAPDGDQGLLTWALSGKAAAEQRVAELEARLAYLESLTVTDELTRLLNRRGFLAELSRALETARSGGAPGAILICDLDGFKAVNDRHGHNAGNRLLRELSASLVRQVRRTDAVARLGGDEFAFLLVGATLPSAHVKAARLRDSIATLDLVIEGAPIDISGSFGVVAYDGSETEETLLHRADMAMYEEKRRRGAHLSVVRSSGRRSAVPALTPAG
ncbi:MAG TPA: GGDEF domain-containing protein [Stellaceae bacterium]|nr:GGDEF domain-containing protein [Stellaceae bacterium]